MLSLASGSDAGVTEPRTSVTPLPLGGLVALAAGLAINWSLAAALASPVFSWTSLLLFAWLLLLLGRISASGLILLLPLVITRGATVIPGFDDTRRFLAS